jgi:ribonuclease HI
MIEIYTDGAAKGNPGPGGYGTILIYKGHRKEITAGYRKTTNNRMELLAVIAGLEALKKPGMEVSVFSDSKYVVDAIEKGWIWGWIKKDFKDKKNTDLWKRFIPLYKNHKVKFNWIKGHSGHPMNERCDQLAVFSAEGSNLLVDEGFESGAFN